MRITERKLRSLIRQVIRENIKEEYENYSESEQEYIDMGLFDSEGVFYCDPPPQGKSTMTIHVTDPIVFIEDPRIKHEIKLAEKFGDQEEAERLKSISHSIYDSSRRLPGRF